MANNDMPRVHVAAGEVARSGKYRWTNRNRPDPTTCVVQLTVGGKGFCEWGSGRIESATGTAIVFNHNDGSIYGDCSSDSGEAYEFEYIAFDAGWARPLFDSLKKEFGHVVQMRRSGEADLLFLELVARYKEQTLRDAIHASELIVRLLFAMRREQIEAHSGVDPVAYGRLLLEADTSGRQTIGILADRIGMSREHFIREYKRRFGESPGVTSRLRRLERARSMLLASRLTLEDIAPLCGFGSADALRRSYRDRYGETPSDTRRN